MAPLTPSKQWTYCSIRLLWIQNSFFAPLNRINEQPKDKSRASRKQAIDQVCYPALSNLRAVVCKIQKLFEPGVLILSAKQASPKSVVCDTSNRGTVRLPSMAVYQSCVSI